MRCRFAELGFQFWGDGRFVLVVYHGYLQKDSSQHSEETYTVHGMALAVPLLVGLSATIPASAAEPLVVDLWPGKTPGDVGIKRQETRRIHRSPLVGPTRLITNVSKPTLTIYQPAR